MSHKVHPKAYRIRRIGDWDSRGYYKNPAKYLEEDFRIREFLGKKLNKLGVEKIEIERYPGKLNIIISSARPGLIIGRRGEGVEELRKELEQKVLKKRLDKTLEAKEKNIKIGTVPPKERKEVRIEIKEIKNPWTSAGLVGQWIAQRIEKRMPYRRVLKQALDKISANKEIQGARVEMAGRLGGAEIARRAWLKKGKLPRQTIRADIDYAKVEAFCVYGVIGIKVWLYKGEKFD